jgi:putative transposase
LRLYREEGLAIRTKERKKRVSLPRVTPPPATHPNERWSMEFLADRLADGQRFRALTIIDKWYEICIAALKDSVGCCPSRPCR